VKLSVEKGMQLASVVLHELKDDKEIE